IMAIAIALGVGLLAGWYGGWIDALMSTTTQSLLIYPGFVIVSGFALFFQALTPEELSWQGKMPLILAIGFASWMGPSRIVRAEVTRIRVMPFIEAARALGGNDRWILLRHVLPRLIYLSLLLVGLQLPSALLFESFMSFLGFGVQSPSVSWGNLIQEGWKVLSSWPHLMLSTSGFVALSVWSINLLIDEPAESIRRNSAQ
ncbi:MAG: ABC transporter permease, partial [Bdellovibrionaceae bacterium]|nr:ABC transporter permease [Pseudobdellovibrionaceae bacterium]